MPVKRRKQDLSKASPLLEAEIRDGRFTPFLGAGASSLWAREKDLDSYPWKEVVLNLRAISSRLSDRSLEFLHAFTKHRLDLSIVGSSPNLDVTHLDKSLLVKLQEALIRATVSLTNYFGVRFSEEHVSIQLVEDCGVAFALDSEDVIGALARDCKAPLLTAADIAFELKQKRRHQRESPFLASIKSDKKVDRRLQIGPLYEKLTILIQNVFGESCAIVCDKHGKHRIDRGKNERGRVASLGRLRLDAIQWLSDLLWYTVRYWVPCYPTTAELAFELSLAVKGAPPRRAELTQAAQALENLGSGLAARAVGDLVAYCEIVQEEKEVADRQMKAFYYSIGASLQYQFAQYKRDAPVKRVTLKDRFGAPTNSGNAEASKLRIPVPMAFTTNFDRALETVFEANDLCFHVVFPVVNGKSPGDERLACPPVWLIRTCYPKWTKRATTVESWSSRCTIEGVPKKAFEGPIIVKLHGSPSLNLDGSTSQHWIVLSEFSYLQALTYRAPSWLEQQLTLGFRQEMRRSLRFLGYSISDWNVRLRLYADQWENRSSRPALRSMVNEGHDVYRQAIFGVLDVEQCVGDLNDFPGIVLRFLEKQSSDKDPEVARLVGKLREIF